MRSVHTLLVVVVLAMVVSGCGGHTSIPPIEQPTHETVYSKINGFDRIYGAPGLADPGTNAEVVDHNARTVVRQDGSFSIDFSHTASRLKSNSSLIPPLFVVNYTKDGKLVEELIFEADYDTATAVHPQLFSTGSGPNDMLYGNDSLYIANSMDNTVTRHSLEGELLATSQFNEFASPSYLGLSDYGLLVTSNGENRLWKLSLEALIGYVPEWLPITSEDYAFPGPGQPLQVGREVIVPWAHIETFNPTVYGEPRVSIHSFYAIPDEAIPMPKITPAGKNAQFCAVDIISDAYYVVSSGEIQFDEFWTPFADSDSFLTGFAGTSLGDSGEGDALNLGLIGAGRIAISPDGTTAFLGNSLNGNLYQVDLANMQVLRGESNPIVLTTQYTFISDVAFTPDGKYVFTTSFNTDELYVVDAATGEVNPGPYPVPFDLSLDPELMAGAANVEIVEDASHPGKYSAYVMFGIANTVSKVDLF